MNIEAISMQQSSEVGVNPFLPPSECIPDGEPRVFGDRLYLFGSHDPTHGTTSCTEDYVCWSASVDDLRTWRCEGVIYRKEQDPYNKDGARAMFAPDVVQGTDGRFYLYYALDTFGQIAVAVCDRPAGKYEFYGIVSMRNSEGEKIPLKDPFPFDPGVLVDEDGKIFLYYGNSPGRYDRTVPWRSNNKGSAVCELDQDMLTVKTDPKYLIPSFTQSGGTSFEGHGFFEASSIRKVNGKYYFIYSSILSHELCYAVSDSPDEGFVYGGTIISNGDIGLAGRADRMRVAYTGNNHGSIIEVRGQWYIFYHRHTQGVCCCRQACAEKIEILPDGSIPQVEMTSCGLNYGPLPTGRQYNSGICCNLISALGVVHINIEGKYHFRNIFPYVTEEEGRGIICHITDGTEFGYKYFAFTGQEKEIEVLLRGKGKGSLDVFIGGSCTVWLTGRPGTQVAKISFDLHGEGWQSFHGKFDIEMGTNSLYFYYRGDGSIDLRGFIIQ